MLQSGTVSTGGTEIIHSILFKPCLSKNGFCSPWLSSCILRACLHYVLSRTGKCCIPLSHSPIPWSHTTNPEMRVKLPWEYAAAALSYAEDRVFENNHKERPQSSLAATSPSLAHVSGVGCAWKHPFQVYWGCSVDLFIDTLSHMVCAWK